MSASLAAELAARLSRHIDLIASSVTTETSSPPSRDEGDDLDDDVDAADELEAQRHSSSSTSASSISFNQLTSILSQLRAANNCGTSDESFSDSTSLRSWTSSSSLTGSPLTAVKLQQLARDASDISSRLAHEAGSIQEQHRASQLQWFVGAQMSVAAYCYNLANLLHQAEIVKSEEAYWQNVDSRTRTTLLYLIQTTPARIADALSVLVQRLQLLAARSTALGRPAPPTTLRRIRKILTPSLLIVTLFPHLSSQNSANANVASADTEAQTPMQTRSTRSLLFLTFSPLLLTRQEVAIKRKRLANVRSDLALQIGNIVQNAEKMSSELKQTATSEHSPDLSTLSALLTSKLTAADVAMTSPHTASGLLDSAQATLTAVPTTKVSYSDLRKSGLLRPSSLTRSWPWLLSTPLVGYYAYSKIYNSRESLQYYAALAIDTARGFVVDWVIDPCIKILATLRHGDDLALMGKDSLRSDFDETADILRVALKQTLKYALFSQSLERMVEDFAKDQKLTGEEVARIVSRVREGDMTLVLETYENDLKSPLKSALAGNLVRTLLIQIQKVKVDVDLAMNGIEQMLKSQQLTFAFVGVAPSMVLLYGIVRWLRNLSGTADSSSTVALRKRVWYSLRTIDHILTDAVDQRDRKAKSLDHQSNGLLLIEATTLREYAGSSAFPTRDRAIRDAFLDDVRSLERASTGLKAKIRVFDRLSRSYARYLEV